MRRKCRSGFQCVTVCRVYHGICTPAYSCWLSHNQISTVCSLVCVLFCCWLRRTLPSGPDGRTGLRSPSAVKRLFTCAPCFFIGLCRPCHFIWHHGNQWEGARVVWRLSCGQNTLHAENQSERKEGGEGTGNCCVAGEDLHPDFIYSRWIYCAIFLGTHSGTYLTDFCVSISCLCCACNFSLLHLIFSFPPSHLFSHHFCFVWG